jgi:hypothetical protein
MFIGSRLNSYEDALPFGAFSDRWVNVYLTTSPLSDATNAAMRDELAGLISTHCADMPDDAARWGWKEPRSIYLLPFFAHAMPTLRFVHFVRDGRDMAFSRNQQQLHKHGNAVLGPWRHRLRRPLRSIALWNEVNLKAADFGERHLADRYLRVRFEDLCESPGDTVSRVLDFFDLDGDAEKIGQDAVKPPATLGRWRDESARTVRALEQIGEPALARFGYV